MSSKKNLNNKAQPTANQESDVKSSHSVGSNGPSTQVVDSGFRKIVKRLFIIVAITMVTVGAYLYFNFTSPSNLPVIVPADAAFFVQFQTRKIRDEIKSPPQAELDTLVKTVASMPALNWVSNPADVGIALFSDVVYFQHPQYQALAVSLNSEPRFKAFLDSLKVKGYVSGLVQKEKYNYIEIITPGWENVYIAFKHKAAVIIQWKSQTTIKAKSIKELFEVAAVGSNSQGSSVNLENHPSNDQHSSNQSPMNHPLKNHTLSNHPPKNHPPKNHTLSNNPPKSIKNDSIVTDASLITDQLEGVLAKIFTGDGNGFVKNSNVQKLYDDDALVLLTNGKNISDGWKMTENNQLESLKIALNFATYQLKQIGKNGL